MRTSNCRDIHTSLSVQWKIIISIDNQSNSFWKGKQTDIILPGPKPPSTAYIRPLHVQGHVIFSRKHEIMADT